MSTIQSKLGPHPLVAEVFEAMKPTVLAASKAVSANPKDADSIRATNLRKLTTAQRYGMAVMEAQHAYLAVIDRIETAARYVRVYPTGTGKGKRGLSRDRWVDYHFGYLTVALASLPDMALLLANAVLQLGLAPRHRTLDVICSHDHVDSDIRKALRAFNKAHHAHIERRNRFVHRGERADIGELTDPKLLDQLRLFGFASKVRPDAELAGYLPVFWTYAMKALKPEIAALEQSTTTHSLALYDSLLPQWRQRWAFLSKVSGRVLDSTT